MKIIKIDLILILKTLLGNIKMYFKIIFVGHFLKFEIVFVEGIFLAEIIESGT